MKHYSFYRGSKWPYPRLALKFDEEFGFETVELCKPPQRLLDRQQHSDANVEAGNDIKRVARMPTPVETLSRHAADSKPSALGRRSLARLLSYFLIAEDPQRRFDQRDVSTLAHQVSLVRHVLDNEPLKRVLIADEVGLGKTVEAGLIIKELLDLQPSLRILYLAPARLVSNVRKEFDRLGLDFRQWSSQLGDARLDDPRLIASIHRAVHQGQRDAILDTDPWDILVVDECHHLSDWAEGGGDPREKFKLVRELIRNQSGRGRVIFLSGTPHQGHASRFENLVGLLKGADESKEAINGRVIFRTKDDVVDWDGRLLFPRRLIRPPLVIDLGADYQAWISAIHDFYSPPRRDPWGEPTAKQRAAGWRCAQAMQWAVSSPHAGLGYLVRQAIRLGARPSDTALRKSLEVLRPYRNGPEDEDIVSLFNRMNKEIQRQVTTSNLEDLEDEFGSLDDSDLDQLLELLLIGVALVERDTDYKWEFIRSHVIEKSDSEKIVFFAQPIETVTSFVRYLKKVTGEQVATIVGGQSDEERYAQVDAFQKLEGPRFLVSSRAGGEGINLQIARRLVHIDVPWNPMDMEQRVGRVHRFGSRKDILVETIVVKDSREEHAYRAAREKLRLIASTMVEPERFESLFSRVICLVPPEELQHLLIDGDRGPLSKQNEQQLAAMVQEGFEKWKTFDERFARQQRQIRQLDTGLARWTDVREYLLKYGKAKEEVGFYSERFQADSAGTVPVQENSNSVVRLGDNSFVACEDLGGLPAYGPNGEIAKQFGLNHPYAMEMLTKQGFETEEIGPAWLGIPKDLWPWGSDRSAAVLVYLRVTMRPDASRGWVEQGTELRYFHIDASTSALAGDGTLPDWRELSGQDARRLVDAIWGATIRTRGTTDGVNLERLGKAEQSISDYLRYPSDTDRQNRHRHAVASIFLGFLDNE